MQQMMIRKEIIKEFIIMVKLRIGRSKVMELCIITNVVLPMKVGSMITKLKYSLVSLPTKKMKIKMKMKMKTNAHAPVQ